MKYDHEIIRDLMPLCIDGIASEKSNAAVQEHIAECPACEKEWEQMKKTINTSENVPVPEDTKKYKETAKRVRKKNRWILLKVTLGTLVLAFIIGYIGNFIDGARFTARGAAKQCIMEHSSDYYEDPIQAKNATPPQLTYIATIKSKDGKAAESYFLEHFPDDGETYVIAGNADRDDILRLGMWIGGGTSGGWAVKDCGISMTGGSFTYENGVKWFGTKAFYVTDKNVKKIEFVMDGQTYELTPDEKGFCAMGYEPYPEPVPDRYIVREGKATDENGKVLYTVQSVTETYGSSEFEHYDWVKASA